jgi:hypothetical protein
MPWKRCEGCTRAISTDALTCEYCGRACDDGLAIPPANVDGPDTFVWPLDDRQSSSTTSNTADETPQELPALDLDSSFPFTAVGDHGLHGEPASEHVPAGTEAFLLEDELNDEPELVTSSPSHATGPAAVEASAAPKKPVGPRQMAMLGGALVAASALIFTILSMRSSASPEPVVGVGAPAPAHRPAANRAPSGGSRTGAVAAAVTPKWTHVMGGRWTGGDKKAVAFELRANNRIHIWTRDVTPLLIVRCQGGQVEPFVYTQSAARMEPQDGDHTVRVAFDDGPEETERWPDSDEHDALFAKDAAAFAQRLAAAQTLRFGFEPHNAPPASAHFDVSGISGLLAASAKPCGWKTVANR